MKILVLNPNTSTSMTAEIAAAFLVPESTMAQRISRAKRTVASAGVDRPGDVRTVMRVLYLVFNEGYSGDVDLAAEAIRLTRQLASQADDPEADGLLALMLYCEARRRARRDAEGGFVPLTIIARRMAPFLIGKDAPIIEKAAREAGFDRISHVPTMEAAVTEAWSHAESGDTIMLSPGCASFDMFNDFEHRGRVFKDAVRDLAQRVGV